MHRAFTHADIPHAFGGALALARCTAQARGTIDIDVNVFMGGEAIERVVAGLPKAVKCSDADVVVLRRELQHRLWWDHTPIELFLNVTPYHDAMSARVRWESFAGSYLPFLGCEDLAVFSKLFSIERRTGRILKPCGMQVPSTSITLQQPSSGCWALTMNVWGD